MASTYTAAHKWQHTARLGSMTALSNLLGVIGAMAITGCLDRPISETEPETHNVFLTRQRFSKVEKIDVLFMIDNSLSMADKQQVLGAAVPQLLRRLTSPDCVDPKDKTAAPIAMENPTAPCTAAGYEREFAPVSDIHIGVITSSLGDYGGYICNDKPLNTDGTPDATRAFYAARDDKAWLLGNLPRAASSFGSPFLSWTPNDAKNFGSSITTKENEFRSFVTAAGEHGCGYEMNLESWYRFLVDPEPPTSVDSVTFADKTIATTRSKDIDQSLLAQRKLFLRPDSLLAVVMLTDENDCSLKDSGASLLLTGTGEKKLKGGSAACRNSPNDRCCYSCDFGGPPAGCPVEANCTGANPVTDIGNLRCYDQKKRYGWDFLFPTNRYVNALRMKTICPYQNYGSLDCDCTEEKARGITDCVGGQRFQNPIFDPTYSGVSFDGDGRTEPEMVFLAGIVGVPWQDVAKPDTLGKDAELRYQLSSQIDWDLILPRSDGTPARDPLMREQVEPRSGTHPLTNEPIGLPTSSTQRQLNSINWHDWAGDGNELQFACVFDLSQPLSATTATATRNCASACPTNDLQCQESLDACPCAGKADPKDKNAALTYPQSPLCQATDGSYGSIQYAAKAYPGTRQLEVLKGHNSTSADNSIVASICPKDLNWNNRLTRGYGYNPAVQALVDRLKTKLTSTCLPRPLVPEEGKLPCAVVEAVPPSASEWQNCAEKRRDEVTGSVRNAVLNGMKDEHLCDAANQPNCAEFVLCQLRQLTDEMDPIKPLTQCQNNVGFENTSPVPGFCYVDPEQHIGSESIVRDCPANRKRMLRIVGDGDKLRAPAPHSWNFIACAGSPYVETVAQ